MSLLLTDFDCIAPQEGKLHRLEERPLQAIDDNPALHRVREACASKLWSALEAHHPVILACDTVVSLKGMPLGKPQDGDEAKQMLASLSGQKHSVYSCVGFYTAKEAWAQKALSFFFRIPQVVECGEFLSPDGHTLPYATIQTNVWFHRLSPAQIDRYIDDFQPLDKAGSYGIQDRPPFPIVSRIEGSLSNVVGLPILPVLMMLLSIDGD